MSNREILRALIKAKRSYIAAYPNQLGLCYHISTYIGKDDYSDIPKSIPEFTLKSLGGTENAFGYWWNIYDTKSRIVAFNKLISIYKKKCSLWDRFLALF